MTFLLEEDRRRCGKRLLSGSCGQGIREARRRLRLVGQEEEGLDQLDLHDGEGAGQVHTVEACVEPGLGDAARNRLRLREKPGRRVLPYGASTQLDLDAEVSRRRPLQQRMAEGSGEEDQRPFTEGGDLGQEALDE